MTLLLSRARLRTDASVGTLRDLLLPSAADARVTALHKVIWSLFADAPERERDFLWREGAPGTFYLLSRRPPQDVHQLFEVDPPKPFEPSLAVGDRLAFSLRANATVTRHMGKDVRGKPEDVVMKALHGLPAAERAAARAAVVEREGRAWLERQGARAGFVLEGEGACRVVAHRVLTLERRGPAARMGVMDFEGVLTVHDPARIVEAIGAGFGRGKAFGNGLMLIRRA